MQRRFPKKGFKNHFRKEIFAVNVGDLEMRFPEGTIDVIWGLAPFSFGAGSRAAACPSLPRYA